MVRDLTVSMALGATLAGSLPLVAMPSPVEAVENSEASVSETRQAAAYEMLVTQNGGTDISPAMVGKLADQMKTAFKRDANMVALDNDHSGLVDHLVDTAIPVIVRQVNRTMPDLFVRQSRYFAEKMTMAEIAEVTNFYRNPAYPSISKKLAGNVDFSTLLNEAIENPDSPIDISGKDLEDLKKGAATSSMAHFTSEERNLLMKFGLSSTGRKLQSLQSGALAIEARWSNESTPEDDKELDDLIIKTMSDFTGIDFAST